MEVSVGEGAMVEAMVEGVAAEGSEGWEVGAVLMATAA